jgi:hypothetical protein
MEDSRAGIMNLDYNPLQPLMAIRNLAHRRKQKGVSVNDGQLQEIRERLDVHYENMEKYVVEANVNKYIAETWDAMKKMNRFKRAWRMLWVR